MNIYEFKNNDYDFKICHNTPSWKLFIDYGVEQAYPLLNINMDVYKENIIIYSIKLNIESNYYCCGSRNFELDKFDLIIIQDCEDTILELMMEGIENKTDDVMNIFKNTLLEEEDIILDYLFY